MADRTVNVNLVARVQGYLAGVKSAAAATKQFATELDQMRTKNAQGYQAVESSLLKVGAALALVTGWAVKTSLEFDKAMSEVQAITGATADEMDRLREAALKAGQSTVFSATEAAGAEAELAKAGLNSTQVMGALPGVLALASAGTISLDEAATAAANSMNQFGLAASDVGHISDLLAGAANATTADVHDLTLALSMGGGAAHAAGMSIEDTLTALGALSKAALRGSDSGTSLKSMLLQLEGPSVKATGVMQKYGFSVYDASGNMVDLYTMAERLRTSFGGLTQQQRNSAFATIFGSDAMRSANALYIQGSAGLRQINKDMLAQADAAGVAATKTDNLAGDINKLKGKLDALFITSSEGATGGLRFIARTLEHLVGTFAALPGPVQSAIVGLSGLSGAALLAGAAFMKVRKSSGEFFAAMAGGGPVISRFGSRMQSIAGVAGKVATGLTAVTIAGSALAALLQDDLNTNLSLLSDSLAEFGRSGKISGEATKVLGDDMDDLGRSLNGIAGDGFTHFGDKISDLVTFGSVLGPVKEKMAAVDQALAQLVQSGHADDAAAAFKRMSDQATANGISLDALKAAFPNYGGALLDLSKDATTATDAIAGTGAATQSEAAQAEVAMQANIKLAGAFGAAASSAGGLKSAFDALNGGFLDSVSATNAAEQNIDDLTKSFHDNGRSLDSNTQKGRDNLNALVDVAKSTRDVMQAKMDETGSVKAADAVYEKYRKKLYDVARAAGFGKDAAHALVDEFLKMPSDKVVNFTVNVHTRGLASVQNSLSKLGHMAEANGGMVDYYASGGENHTAQIAPAGAMRVWAEPETGGEAYIPLSAAKRGRSMEILSDVARRFNMAVTPRIDHRALASALAGQQSGPSAAAIGHAVRAALAGVTVVMDGRAVGTVQGRQADVLGRTF